MDPLFSPNWYRVAELRPRLRSHTRVHRHVYRKEPWFVLQDLSTGRFQRFRPATWYAIGLMDGERSVAAIWQSAAEHLGEESPSQDDLIRLLAPTPRSSSSATSSIAVDVAWADS